MDAAIQIKGKKVVKVLEAACLATGVVALSAVVASGAAVGAIVEGFRFARDTMQKALKRDENAVADGAVEEITDTTEKIIEMPTEDKALAAEQKEREAKSAAEREEQTS